MGNLFLFSRWHTQLRDIDVFRPGLPNMIAPNNGTTVSHLLFFSPHSCFFSRNFPSSSLSSSLAPHHPACSLSSRTHLFLILPSTGDSEPLQHVRKSQQVTLSQHHSAYLFWALPDLVIAKSHPY